MGTPTIIILKNNNIRIIIMIVSKILSPSEISGSHTSLDKTYSPMPSQAPIDFSLEAAILVKEAKTQLPLMERNRITHWV